jgi:hypothetical protein
MSSDLVRPIRRNVRGCRAVGRPALVAALAIGILVATGCSSGSAGPQAPSSGPSLTASTKAKSLLADAKIAAARATSVEVTGPLTLGPSTATVDLTLAGTGVAGTVRIGGGQAEVRAVAGQLYVRGDAAFWNALVKGTGKEFAAQWVRVSAATAAEFGALLRFVPVEAWLDALAPSAADRAEVPGQVVNGVSTVGLQGLASAADVTVYVSTGKPAYPLLIRTGGGGAVTLSRWGATVKAPVAPTGSMVDATRVSLRG